MKESYMKKLVLIVLGLLFASSLSYAQLIKPKVNSVNQNQPSSASASEVRTTQSKIDTVTLKGYVIDNACAAQNKEKLAEFVKSHPKTCLVKGSCASSGYSIYSGGKLEKFSKG